MNSPWSSPSGRDSSDSDSQTSPAPAPPWHVPSLAVTDSHRPSTSSSTNVVVVLIDPLDFVALATQPLVWHADLITHFSSPPDALSNG